jgi:serine/threonine protein kinase
MDMHTGGTLHEMFNLDNKYGKNISLWVVYENTSDKDFFCAQNLRRFQKKQTELTWALLYIINDVHKKHNLHNDISPNNIFLHFLAKESQVYIGICDWGMATKSMEPMKSLYTFTDALSMTNTLDQRWWVDHRVTYVHKLGGDV